MAGTSDRLHLGMKYLVDTLWDSIYFFDDVTLASLAKAYEIVYEMFCQTFRMCWVYSSYTLSFRAEVLNYEMFVKNTRNTSWSAQNHDMILGRFCYEVAYDRSVQRKLSTKSYSWKFTCLVYSLVSLQFWAEWDIVNGERDMPKPTKSHGMICL